MQEEVPVLSLRMKRSKFVEVPSYEGDNPTSLEILAVMTSQDAAYKCRDYLGRRKMYQTLDSSSRCVSSFELQEDAPDTLCREKMCEWSYRVCDHFHTSREIVAYAFSFLDRFIDRCSCDRTAFKLASMTSLYMATKVFNSKQISITSLADLSRGEFDVDHISEMEKIILETLEWRMNPPTVQSFIDRLFCIIPFLASSGTEALYHKAMFLAELCIYDYEFVTQRRYLIAVACILNATEAMVHEHQGEDAHQGQDLSELILTKLRSSFDVDLDMVALENARDRLWFLYSCSAELQQQDELTRIHVVRPRCPDDKAPAPASSPITVEGVY